MAIVSINPATGAELPRFDEHNWRQVAAALDRAWTARRPWSETRPGSRASRFAELASLLRHEKPRLGALLTAEMGKPITEAEAEVEKCAWTAEWCAAHAEAMLTPQRGESSATQ